MKRRASVRVGLAAVLVLVLVAGVAVSWNMLRTISRTTVVAYFANSNGIFPGDDVRILGVPVGRIDSIEPQPQRVKVTFWFDRKYQVPADAKALIVAPSLVTARAIQLVPAYTGGPTMKADAVIPQSRTAVPVEWDDLRVQLQKLTETLQPSKPGGVSTLGAFINTAADNLRGEGSNIRETIIKLSQAISALGDHSGDIFGTIKNLSTLVSALQFSSDVMSQLNRNLAAVTALLADDPQQVGRAVTDLNTAVGDVQSFVADNREALGTTSDKLASLSTAVVESLDDIKQTLHVLPNTVQNFNNIYQPAQASLSGVLAAANFANPLMFLCGAIQAASRLGAEQAAKLCVQYLAPIVKNRQYNFPPLGINPFVGTQARPNEVTYSEDWMRPDFRPTPPPDAAPAAAPGPPADGAPLPAEAPAPPSGGEPEATNPADGLTGMMVPHGAGS
ncbi:virulence factor Mce family protein [Mycobacterium sp.]|uniref:virulence factor Mce family protein n=1 Tax=Mycobacterium sp. TaxID=1785 RepID=UPI002D8494A1|nr:virulence factor Mce family protein [Mycobacterium sp.]